MCFDGDLCCFVLCVFAIRWALVARGNEQQCQRQCRGNGQQWTAMVGNVHHLLSVDGSRMPCMPWHANAIPMPGQGMPWDGMTRLDMA